MSIIGDFASVFRLLLEIPKMFKRDSKEQSRIDAKNLDSLRSHLMLLKKATENNSEGREWYENLDSALQILGGFETQWLALFSRELTHTLYTQLPMDIGSYLYHRYPPLNRYVMPPAVRHKGYDLIARFRAQHSFSEKVIFKVIEKPELIKILGNAISQLDEFITANWRPSDL